MRVGALEHRVAGHRGRGGDPHHTFEWTQEIDGPDSNTKLVGSVDSQLSVREVGTRLNDVLLSALAVGSGASGRPRDVFAALVACAGA